MQNQFETPSKRYKSKLAALLHPISRQSGSLEILLQIMLRMSVYIIGIYGQTGTANELSSFSFILLIYSPHKRIRAEPANLLMSQPIVFMQVECMLHQTTIWPLAIPKITVEVIIHSSSAGTR